MNIANEDFANASVIDDTSHSKLLTSVDTITDIESIKALKDEWLNLENHCPNSVLFQSWAWCNNYLDFISNSPEFSPVVLTVRHAEKLVALLPLCIQNLKGMKVLTGLTEPFQHYSDILLANGVEPSEIADDVFHALKSLDVDYFHAGQVRADSALAKVLTSRACRVGASEYAPYVSLNSFSDFETYYKSVASKTREDMRDARDKLSKTGEITHETSNDGQLLSDVIDRAYDRREAWLEQLGITSRAFTNTDFEAFIKRFKNSKVTGVETLAMAMKHGGSSMSDQWGFVYKGRYYSFMAVSNECHDASSPKAIHMHEVMDTCFDRGIEVADFMSPACAYELAWTHTTICVEDFVLPLSKKGFIYANLWLNFLRPLAKKVLRK